jgi:hypothetical protein
MCLKSLFLSVLSGNCTDINECESPQACLYGTCINTQGKFICQCPSNYELIPAGNACVGMYCLLLLELKVKLFIGSVFVKRTKLSLEVIINKSSPFSYLFYAWISSFSCYHHRCYCCASIATAVVVAY